MINNAGRDEAVVTVHSLEMTAELAAALAAEATRVSNAHRVRRSESNGGTCYEVASVCCPRDEVPGGKPGHIEQRGRELIIICDEAQIAPDLAARLAAILGEAGQYYYVT
jgi:hypothetical protein